MEMHRLPYALLNRLYSRMGGLYGTESGSDICFQIGRTQLVGSYEGHPPHALIVIIAPPSLAMNILFHSF